MEEFGGINVAFVILFLLIYGGISLKDIKLLIWLTQLGISVAAPLGGFVWLSIWLRQRFALGIWVVFVGIFVGVVCAVDGLRVSLKAMQRMSNDEKDEPPCVSFNNHE